MSVLAVGCCIHCGAGYVTVSGTSIDGTVHFDPNAGTINVPVDFESTTLNQDIQDGLKAKLQAAPYSMVFGPDDTVRIAPAWG